MDIEATCRKCDAPFLATAKYLRDKRCVCLACYRTYARLYARKYRKTEKHAAYIAKYYAENKASYAVRHIWQAQKRKDIVASFKAVPCTDCGITYPPCVMDFDHVSGTKDDNIGSMLRSRNLPVILAEIKKCEVVCANCHRLRTHTRRENKKHGRHQVRLTRSPARGIQPPG